MIKNTIFRRIALLISLIALLTSTIGSTFGLIITKTESMINTFVPFESIVSHLVITKDIEHPLGEDYEIPDNIAFDFKIDFGSLYSKTTIETSLGKMVADEKGSIIVSIKPGQPFSVKGIDEGTKVTVTEIQVDGSGFTVKDGVTTKEGIVAADGSLKFEYVNVYKPVSTNPVDILVQGSVTLEGREWQDGDTFTIILEQKQPDGTWLTVDTEVVVYHPEDSDFNHFDFNDLVHILTFDEVGTNEFRMTQLIGNLENVVYDKSVNNFTVEITDKDMDGALEIGSVVGDSNTNIVKENGVYTIAVIFRNTYSSSLVVIPEDIEVPITVNKTIKNQGKDTIGPDGFEFVLENTETGEKLTLLTDKNGNAVFRLPFTSADIDNTYSYKLYETDKGVAGVTYDKDVYDIKIAITLNENNELVATVTMNGEVVTNAVATFENIYSKPVTPPGAGEDTQEVDFWTIVMLISAFTCLILAPRHRRRVR